MPAGLPDEVRDRFDAQSGMVLADAGYCNGRDPSELEARGIDGYMATGHEGKHAATHRMVEKPATPAGRERYAHRK